MTTIAWDGKTLAADRQRNMQNGPMRVTKLRRNVGKYLAFAGAGEVTDIARVIRWIRGGSHVSQRPTLDEVVTCIAVRKDGRAVLIHGKVVTAWTIQDPFYAIGSGGDFAMGALAAGQSASHAVAIAQTFDLCSGLGVDHFTFEGGP